MAMRAEAEMQYGAGGILKDALATTSLEPGDIVNQAGLAGVVLGLVDIVSGEMYAIATKGVAKVTKQAGVAWAVGDSIYWDTTNNYANKTSSGNTLLGKAKEIAASAATDGLVVLNE